MKILDIGGSMKQLHQIPVDTLVDLISPEKSPYHPSPLHARKFVRLDIENNDLPFADKSFDFCYSSHTLEDLFYPTRVITEMGRVARRGLIITPSRGQDITFDRFNLTQWRTGARRMPGLPHHHWLFEVQDRKLIITPKVYPLLYTPDFEIIAWSGPEETVYYWENKPRFDQKRFMDIFEMISDYREFSRQNSHYITPGLTNLPIDSPQPIVKEYIKMILRKKKT